MDERTSSDFDANDSIVICCVVYYKPSDQIISDLEWRIVLLSGTQYNLNEILQDPSRRLGKYTNTIYK